MSFKVYKSSAGSGKTYTLVKEYLKLVLPEPDKFRHILAITFTNKAANEMKERVVESLHNLSLPSGQEPASGNSGLLATLITELNFPAEKIRVNAEESLRLILHDYSDFSIGTIDSFSHRIIRTFAHDFGLQVNFNVEVDSDELLTTAVDLLMDKIGEDEGLTNLLVRFIESRMDDEQDWNIDRILLNFARILLDEDGKEYLEKLRDLTLPDFSRIAGTLKKEAATFEKTIRTFSEKATALIRAKNIPSQAFYQGRAGIPVYFMKLSEGRMDAIDPNSYVLKTMEEDKWTSPGAGIAEVESILALKPELTSIYNEIHAHYDRGKSRYHLDLAILRTLYPMAVLNEIGRLLDGFKKQNNIVHISEFNQRISGFILKEPVPFIYERLGEKFNHILIDEFQDTSVLQWHNLLPLVENSLSSGYFNLIVGDGKQAIYRWRNGDVQQFAELPSIPGSEKNPVIRDREKILKDHYHKVSLETNFRSKKEIVKFNNSFFGVMRSFLKESKQTVYEGLEQNAKEGSEGGYIRFEFSGRELKGMEFRESLWSRILEQIGELEKSGYRKQDIAILCRRNKEGSEIARFLLAHRVDVVSAESLLLIHSAEVNFLVGFTRMLNESSGSVLIAELVTYLYGRGKLNSPALHDVMVRIPLKGPLKKFMFGLLEENDIHLNPEMLKTRPVYDAIEEMVRVFYPDATADPYIQFFLDTVQKYSRKHSSNAVDFLEWWDEHKDTFSIIMPGGLNAVRILTMHKAKGLQFPVVILPFFPEKKMYTKKYLWVDLPPHDFDGLPASMLETGGAVEKTQFSLQSTEEKDKTLLDSLNLLYVAMTRPEERLYIFSPAPPVKTALPDTPSSFFLHYLKSQGLWTEGTNTYEFGTETAVKRKDILPSLNRRSLTSMISADWREKVLIRTSAPESWDVNDPQKNRTWGNLVHTALSRILCAGDEEKVLDGMMSGGLIEDVQKEILLKEIRSVITNPGINRFFEKENKARNEAEILSKDGHVYRPDRIIFYDDETVVLDFKTGKPKEEYTKQLIHYGKLLNELGYRNVKKYLVFIEQNVRLVEIN